MKNSALLLAACALAVVALSYPAHAIDLTGAWATDKNVCDKVFTKKGKTISFKGDSEAYGSGFIVEGNAIRGKMARCTIKARKVDGAITHLITACSTDIALAKVQFSLKAVDDNNVIRLYPGMEEMEVQYSRCFFN
jgi:hypothetical protein